MALIDICIDGSGAEIIGEHRLHVPAASWDSMLLDALEGLVFVLDTTVEVAVRAQAHPLGDGGFEILLAMADRGSIEPIGSAPKAISRSGLIVEKMSNGVRCRYLVDV